MRFPRAVRLDTSDPHVYEVAAEPGEIDQARYEEVVRRLADHFVACYGAPDREAALPAAREEAAFAAGLCDQKVQALRAVQREFGENGVVDWFKVIRPPKDGRLARSWTVVEDDAPG